MGSMSYPYTQHLLQLDQCIAPWEAPERIGKVESPLIIDKWAFWRLQDHPDQQLAKYLLEGISKGFQIGFQCSNHVRQALCINLVSAFWNPEYIKDEQTLGKIIGLLDPMLAEKVHSSPFGVIPKHHSPGKWRLILSSPQGASINDSINPE